jgi:outer membrane protein OmpA-like peptidoglycan-associated protein
VLGAALAFAASAQIFSPLAAAPNATAAPSAAVRSESATSEPAVSASPAEIAAREASADLARPMLAPTGPASETIAPSAPAAPLQASGPAPSPAIVPAPAAEPSVCLPIVSIPFDLNSVRLKTTGLDALVTPLRGWLAAHSGAVLSAEGHADATGPESYNVVLSYKRAEAAAAWLTLAGVAPEQIATRAAGTRAPSRRSANASSTNRQVILQIEGVEPCRDDGAPAQNP